MNEILASIHGNLCGDGCVSIFDEKRCLSNIKKYNRKKIFRKRYCVVYTNSRLELIKKFEKNIKKSFPWVKFVKYRKNEVRLRDKKVVMFLLNYSKYGSYKWSIPNMIMDGKDKLKTNWLCSFFDDEATVDGNRIVVSSVNKSGLKQVYKLLGSLGFKKIKFYSFESRYCIYITRPELCRFQKFINFTHKIKKEKLSKLIK